jgi:CubicO group peptidase (beta-lactamase class C family)
VFGAPEGPGAALLDGTYRVIVDESTPGEGPTLGSTLMSAPDPSQPIRTDWRSVAPETAGFAPDLAERLGQAVQDGRLPNLHAVLVARGGTLVIESYFQGSDDRWGQSLGEVSFGPEIKHDLRSVSKSVVGLLYGIALAEGKVPALDQPIVDHFPYPDLAADPERRRITIAHALSMTLGTPWDESLPYTDPRNSEIAMELAPDRYRFVLNRPLVAEPGSRWVYNGGTTALLAHLTAEGTGTPLHDYAREKLFAPLGITDTEWVPGSNGEPAAASGLRMRPRDLARIGLLVLQHGRWGDRQVVPADWLEASFEARVPSEEELAYGYQWWLWPREARADGRRWMAGFGNGGQRLMIVPHLDLVVVVTAGNYNQPDAWQLPVAVVTEILLPALQER